MLIVEELNEWVNEMNAYRWRIELIKPVRIDEELNE